MIEEFSNPGLPPQHQDVAPSDAARAAQAVLGKRSASKYSPRSGIDLHHLIASAK